MGRLVAAVLWLLAGTAHAQEHRVAIAGDADRASLLGPRHAECDPPCAVELPSGRYELKLYRDSHRRPFVDSVRIDRDLTIASRWNDRSLERIAGWITFVTGAAVGNVMNLVGVFWMMAAAGGDGGLIPDEAIALSAGGTGILIATLSIGLSLAFHFDDVSFEVR